MTTYVGHALARVDGEESDVARTAFDVELVQKVLPKLNGGRELEAPLAQLLAFCLDGSGSRRVDAGPIVEEAAHRLSNQPALSLEEREDAAGAQPAAEPAQPPVRAAAPAYPRAAPRARAHARAPEPDRLRLVPGVSAAEIPEAAWGEYRIQPRGTAPLIEHGDGTLEILAEREYLVEMPQDARDTTPVVRGLSGAPRWTGSSTRVASVARPPVMSFHAFSTASTFARSSGSPVPLPRRSCASCP
jgi:pyruvate/2-oxoglutarate dehydrogenase complex dihydrolipoamide acyltransferase (E2) component